jgi:hypothetical protein
MNPLKSTLDGSVIETVSYLAQILNIIFFIYYIRDSHFKKLKFELYVDNWIKVKTRCGDPNCENPHFDFTCTVVGIGPKDKVSVLSISKTLMKCPSGNNVDVSPNNHIHTNGTYWGSKTPIILSGGDKKSFIISYKPELDKLKVGTYEIEVKLKSKDGKHIVSTTQKIKIDSEILSKLNALSCNQEMTLESEDIS